MFAFPSINYISIGLLLVQGSAGVFPPFPSLAMLIVVSVPAAINRALFQLQIFKDKQDSHEQLIFSPIAPSVTISQRTRSRTAAAEQLNLPTQSFSPIALPTRPGLDSTASDFNSHAVSTNVVNLTPG